MNDKKIKITNFDDQTLTGKVSVSCDKSELTHSFIKEIYKKGTEKLPMHLQHLEMGYAEMETQVKHNEDGTIDTEFGFELKTKRDY